MATSYTHTTLSDLRAQLAARLGDPSMVHWISAELDEILRSTLSRWALYTGIYRVRAAFSTSSGVAFYDLSTQSELADYLSHARTDRDELGLMQYMLLEPYDPIDGTGMSEQFTFAQLTSALQRARDQFLADTLHNLGITSIIVDPDEPTPSLEDTVIAVRRAVWLSQDGARTNVHLADEHEATAYAATYPNDPGTPELYSIVGVPQLSIRLMPPPIDTGTLELIVASTGATLAPTTAATPLGIPDDTAWIIRALALADLLGRDGPAYDPSRASYCRAEYEFGVTLVTRAPVLLSAELDGVPVLPCALGDLDYAYGSPHWQSSALGTPSDLGTIGDDLIALRPMPDTDAHSITVDVVRKAPQPLLDADFVQVSREDLSAILDGAESLAMFKLGGAAIDDAMRLSRQMLSAAARYNSRISVHGYADAMSRISRLEDEVRPTAGAASGTGTVAARDLKPTQT